MSKTSFQSKGNKLNKLLEGVEVEWTTVKACDATSWASNVERLFGG
jgi:hypothetical protein